MSRKNPSVVALELSRSYLKLVEFLPAENQISMVASKPLDASRWTDEAYLSEQIKHSIAKHVADPEVDLVTCMSAEHAVIRQVEVPQSEDNIIDALQWEMEQYLISPLDEYLLDYQALGSNQVYSPDLNQIFDIATGDSVWSSVSPRRTRPRHAGAVAGNYVWFASGATIRVEPR